MTSILRLESNPANYGDKAIRVGSIKNNQTELFLPNSRIRIANRKTDSCWLLRKVNSQWVFDGIVMACVCVCVVECWIADSAVNPARFRRIVFLALYQESTVCSWRVWQPILTSSRYEMQWCFAHSALSSARLWMILSENSIIVDSLALYQDSSDVSWRVRQVISDIDKQVCDAMMFCSQRPQFCAFMDDSFRKLNHCG